MEIQAISNNYNSSFKGLYASKETLRACNTSRLRLLCNKNIKAAADKYEVVINKGSKEKKVEKDIILRFGNTLMAAGFGTVAGLVPALAMSQPQLMIMGTILGGLLGSIQLISAFFNPYKTVNNLSIQAGRKVIDGHAVGCATDIYEVDDLRDVPNLVKEVDMRCLKGRKNNAIKQQY